MFSGLIKQKEGRIGINVKQVMHEKTRAGELNIKNFMKKAEEEYNQD